MTLVLLISSLWIGIVTIWHTFLIYQRRSKNRPPTLSEHAAEEHGLLRMHRIIHSLSVLMSTPLAVKLVMSDYFLAGLALMTGAVFDSIQSLTLTKQNASLENKLNSHSISAWLMAVSYYFYAAVISNIAGIPVWLYALVLICCAVLLLCAVTNTFKGYFLAMQMSFFVLISGMSLAAHIAMIL